MLFLRDHYFLRVLFNNIAEKFSCGLIFFSRNNVLIKLKRCHRDNGVCLAVLMSAALKMP